MKQKDLSLVFVVVFVAAIFSLVISNLFISSPKNRQAQVEVVKAISTEFKTPNSKYFNDNSIDPTQLITIGDDNNKQPFNPVQP